MPDTPLLGLPLLAAAQAQKHVTHNEALLRLEGVVQLSVSSRALTAPPAAADGERYLVAAPSTGAWAAQAGQLALAQGGGWVFLTPRKGWCMWVEAEAKLLVFDGTQWREPFTASIPASLPRLGLNATADDVNRLAVSSAAALFTHAGSDHRLKLNKNAAGDTASLIYQTNWSGRAEMGLAGSDDFRINVSADGAQWKTALAIDRASGAVSLPSTPPAVTPPPVLYAQSLAAQGPGFAADSYLGGSAIALPSGRIRAGTRYVLAFDISKTAAGVAPPVLSLRCGAVGALGDAAIAVLTFGAQTAVIDDGRLIIEATFRSAGPSAVLQVLGVLEHSLASTGLATTPAAVRRATSAAFDATAANVVLGVSLTGGLNAAWTVSLVQARLENLA